MQQPLCKIKKSNVDWSGFPSDLLFLISKRLPQLFDFIRFRSVCKNWRLCAPRSAAPPQLPWHIKFWYLKDDTFVSSLSSCKQYIVQVPQMVKHMQLIAHGQTYVLLRDCKNNSLFLLNPLIDEEHPLPPLPEYICHIQAVQICKDDIVLICYSNGRNQVFFSRIDGERWSIVEGERTCLMTVSCTYYKGTYFVLYGVEEPTKIINATTGQVVSVINPPPGCALCEYMVESSGDILRVQLCLVLGPFFCIYRLDYGGGNSRWIKLHSIGDRILFLGNQWTRQTCLYGFSLRSCNVTGSRGNCIYSYTIGRKGLGLYRYDIEENTAEFFPKLSLVHCDWFVPGLH